jgi:hypothetical protein
MILFCPKAAGKKFSTFKGNWRMIMRNQNITEQVVNVSIVITYKWYWIMASILLINYSGVVPRPIQYSEIKQEGRKFF